MGDAGLTLTASIIVHSYGTWLSTGKPLVGMGLVHAVLHHAMPVSWLYVHEYVTALSFMLLLRLPKRQGWCSVCVLSGTQGHFLTRLI